jgi:hypothetical protein
MEASLEEVIEELRTGRGTFHTFVPRTGNILSTSNSLAQTELDTLVCVYRGAK